MNEKYLDLTDCNITTHFETLDYEMTLNGANFGKIKGTDRLKMCTNYFRQIFNYR